MRKIILVVMFFVASFVYGTGTPVIDITAIATAIENGVTMYQQLQTAYNQYETTVQQLEQAKKNMESIDLSSIDQAIYNKMLNSASSYLNDLENIENVIQEKNMEVGGLRFSLEDLYTTDVYQKIEVDEEDKLLNPDNMTDEEKKQFFLNHGMNVDTFNKLCAVSKELGDKGKEAKAKCKTVKENVNTALKSSGNFTESATSQNSEVALAQRNLQALGGIMEQTTHVAEGVIELTEIIATQVAEQALKEQKAKEIEDTYSNFGNVPDYVKNSVGEESDYLQW